jgi:hypothetical protein
MVEDAGLPARPLLSIAVRPVLEFEEGGWEERFDVAEAMRETAARLAEDPKAHPNSDRERLRARLVELREELGAEPVYAVAVARPLGMVAANTVAAAGALTAQWKEKEKWFALPPLDRLLLRWNPKLWTRTPEDKPFKVLELTEAAAVIAEVFGEVTALEWRAGIDGLKDAVVLLPGSPVTDQFPAGGPIRMFEAALKSISDEDLLSIVPRALCKEDEGIRTLLPWSVAFETAVHYELVRRIPGILPAALDLVESLGQKTGNLRFVLSPSGLAALAREETKKLEAMPELKARLVKTLQRFEEA